MERRDSIPAHALSADGNRDVETGRDARTGALDGKVESLPTDQVVLAGRREEADLIIKGLRLLRTKSQEGQILDNPTHIPGQGAFRPNTEELDRLISSIEQPQFQRALAEE